MTSLVRFPSIGSEVRTWRNGKGQNILSQSGEHQTLLAGRPRQLEKKLDISVRRRQGNISNKKSEQFRVTIVGCLYSRSVYSESVLYVLCFKNLCVLALDESCGPWFCSSHTAVGMMIWKGRVH